jgi:hypothetical protein
MSDSTVETLEHASHEVLAKLLDNFVIQNSSNIKVGTKTSVGSTDDLMVWSNGDIAVTEGPSDKTSISDVYYDSNKIPRHFNSNRYATTQHSEESSAEYLDLSHKLDQIIEKLPELVEQALYKILQEKSYFD